MIWLSSFLLGGALAAIAAVAHAALFPLGLVIALFGAFAGLRLITNRANSRTAGVVAGLAFAIVTLRAALPSTTGEVLIWGQMEGTVYLAGSALVVILAVLLPPKPEPKKPEFDAPWLDK